MEINNIFTFVGPKSKKRETEDSLSISFGFVLWQDKRLLGEFLSNLGLKANCKKVKISTQEVIKTDEQWGETDIEFRQSNEFQVILESKIVKHNDANLKQLEKYAEYLNVEKRYYPQGIRLVYITKDGTEQKNEIRKKLKLDEQEFYCFSWKDILELVQKSKQKAYTKLFTRWIGDRMHNTKRIKEQRIEDIEEVIAVYTNPLFMKLLFEKNVIVQQEGARDAQYIAIIDTGKKPSKITHICRVKETRIERREHTYANFSELEEMKSQYKDFDKEHKVYAVEPPVKLFREILMSGQKGQKRFTTTIAEMFSKQTGKEMKTKGQIKAERTSKN